MNADLTLANARAERDALADRIDVLDRVGALRSLPDDMHVTTSMVAEFYAVGVEAIKSLVKDNRDEIEEDGYRVVIRSEFERFYGDPSNLIDPRSRQIALFPRRAVLRVGMLLRDSEIAKQVRTYLLDAEQVPQSRAMTDDEIIHRALTLSAQRVEKLTARVAELEPKAEVADRLLDASGDYSVKDAASALTRAGIKTGQGRLFADLACRRWIHRAKGDGKWRPYQQAIETGYVSVLPQSHYHPKTGVLVLDPPQVRVTTKGLQTLLSHYGAEL